MAKKSISPLEQHVEKIILGIGVLVAIWFFYTQIVAPKPLQVLPKDVVDVREALEDVVDPTKRPVPELQLPQIDVRVKEENKPGHFFPIDQPVEYNPLVPWAPLYKADRSREDLDCIPPQVAGLSEVEAVARQVTQMIYRRAAGAVPAANLLKDRNVIDFLGMFDMKAQRELLKQESRPEKKRLPPRLQFTCLMWPEWQRQQWDPAAGKWAADEAALDAANAPYSAPETKDLTFVPHHWPPKPKLPFTVDVREGNEIRKVPVLEDRLRNIGEKAKQGRVAIDERKYIDLMKDVLKLRILKLWQNQEKVRLARPAVYVPGARGGSLQYVDLLKYVPAPPAPAIGALPVGPGGQVIVQPLHHPIQVYDWPYPKEVAQRPVILRPEPPAGGPDVLPPDTGALPADPRRRAGPLKMHQKDKVAVYIHDSDVKTGVKYRYRMRVRIYNPLYGQSKLTEPANWAKLSLVGPWSAWSNPITLEDRTDYWLSRVTRAGRGEKQASFDIYKNVHLFPRKLTATVKIGQRIAVTGADLDIPDPTNRPIPPAPGQPGVEQNIIKKTVDFDTGAHLIDCDPDNRRPNLQGQPMRDPLAVILTADGKLVERSVNADRNDELYRQTVDLNEIGKKLPPGKAVREQRRMGFEPGGRRGAGFMPRPDPGFMPRGGEPGMGGVDDIYPRGFIPPQ